MPNLNKPLSVRVSDEDMQFLSEYQANDAITPSEKIRALIKEARLQRASLSAPDAAHRTAQSLLAPIWQQVHRCEDNSHTHSELLASQLAWCEDLISDLLMLPNLFSDEPVAALKEAEMKTTERILLMVDRLLRYGLTSKAPAYSPEILTEKLRDLDEILKLYAAKPSPSS